MESLSEYKSHILYFLFNCGENSTMVATEINALHNMNRL